jgi:hypothetical protein
VYAIGTLTVNGGAISGNTAKWGGGGAYGSGAVTLDGAEISGNATTDDDGGGISAAKPLTVTGGKISGNRAEKGNGGGARGNGEVTLTGGAEISANTSAQNGGGVYSEPIYAYAFPASESREKNTAIPDGAEALAEGTWIKWRENGYIVADGAYWITRAFTNLLAWYEENGWTRRDEDMAFGSLYYTKMNESETLANRKIHAESAAFADNRAGADGGAIWTAFLESVTVGANVTFSGNASAAPADWDITNPFYAAKPYKLTHDANVAAGAVFTAPHNNAYSNDDINFALGEGDAPPTYTVNYLPGARGTFAAQSHEGLSCGAATPAFAGTPEGETGWRFIGWSPAVAETVTESVDYAAQWARDAKATVTARKTALGAPLRDQQFEFGLFDSGNNEVGKARNDANGNVTFPPLSFSEAGEYKFTVRELTPSGGGWTTDSKVYRAVVTVTAPVNAEILAADDGF